MNISKFHNPYHFVPVNPDDQKAAWQQKVDFFQEDGNKLGFWSHKRYAAGVDIFHGRIVCKLTTKSPIFIGDKRTKDASDDAPAEVKPFELDGQPAIPASSLRGMISSIAEAASNSALRVLEDKLLSRRMDMRESLNAIGMLKKKAGTDELELLPLIMPPFLCDQNGRLKSLVPLAWQRIFKTANLKVYIDGYCPDSDKKPSLKGGSFLERKDPNSYSASNIEYWYMKLNPVVWGNDDPRKKTIIATRPRIKEIRTRNGSIYFLTGQSVATDNNQPISQTEYDALRNEPERQKEYTKGILRVLGITGRENDIPQGKTHEIFIPLPQGVCSNACLNVDDALAKFYKLADQRTNADADLPFTLKGMERVGDNKQLRLTENDLVFFSLKNEGSIAPEVKEISVSSIWRNDAGGTVFEYFSSKFKKGAVQEKEHLPFHAERNKISPAEMVFGFVEDRKKDVGQAAQEKESQALSYAGRVRFSHGIWQQDEENQSPYNPPVTLKILDSPKPPSPALYFTMKEGDPKYIAKKTLNLNEHKPQGRKFYLHKHHDESEPWRSRNTSGGQDARLKQKVRITPIPSERSFWFHIDFDNLNKYELGMLLYALKPDENFCHKIGMGKPLGLGSISIEPAALHLIDRQKRYVDSGAFSASRCRYTQSLIINNNAWDVRPSQYRQSNHPANFVDASVVSTIRAFFEKTVQPEIGHALKMLGDPENVMYPVHTPLQKNQVGETAAEKDSFKWFTANDKEKNSSQQQVLKPINLGSILPYLSRN